MCTVKDVSTHYWTDKVSGKTLATVALTVKLSDGTLKTHEYQCPTPVEDWEACSVSQENYHRHPTTPRTNMPADPCSSRI